MRSLPSLVAAVVGATLTVWAAVMFSSGRLAFFPASLPSGSSGGTGRLHALAAALADGRCRPSATSRCCSGVARLVPESPLPVSWGFDPEGDDEEGAGAGVGIVPEEDLVALRAELQEMLAEQDAGFSLRKDFHLLDAKATLALQYGPLVQADEALVEMRLMLERHEERFPHEAGFPGFDSNEVAKTFIKSAALREFLQSGRVLSRSHLGTLITDDAYMEGIIFTLGKLRQYALRRATALDAQSVSLCRSYLVAVKAQLLGFDFRNGALRRRFDTVKYAEKDFEDLLYQLSLAVPSSIDGIKEVAEGSQLDEEEWKQLQTSYADLDERRELAIKHCRDVQKAAKQAIYAAQRGDLARSSTLIASAKEALQTVLHVGEGVLPALRGSTGALDGALEELAEAEMLRAWRGGGAGGFLIPRRADMGIGLLTATDYVGALSDFTGEVGRIAVEAATQRDIAGFRRAMKAVFAAQAALSSLPLHGLRSKLADKLQAAERNLQKVEALECDIACRRAANDRLPGGRYLDGGFSSKALVQEED